MAQSISLSPNNLSSVCKDCTAETGRSPSCHATCDKYLKEVEERKAKAEEIRKIKKQLKLPDEVIIAGKQKRKKIANIMHNYSNNK